MSFKFTLSRSTWIGLLAFTFLLATEKANATGVLCKMHLGSGCNGPSVYEIQLCSSFYLSGIAASLDESKCEKLCAGLKPVCNVGDFDGWVSAYNSSAFFGGHLGQKGFKGDLAGVASDHYDENGQLVTTSGNAYTVCMTVMGVTKEMPMQTTSPTCPVVVVPSALNCKGGTVFNNDPTNPRCVTNNSYCAGGGSAGNFAGTMSTGFTLVDVQNEHFVNAGTPDSNLNRSASTGSTVMPGLVAPTIQTAIANDQAQPAHFSNTGNGGAPASSAGNGAGSGLAATASTTGSHTSSDDTPKGPRLASANGALVGDVYSAGSTGDAGKGGSGGGTANGAGGISWFGAGSVAVNAGGASADLGFSSGRVSRGLASDGTLQVDDPANYFMLSDVEVSLFKRVTAQCRKKERSLVLAP